MEEKRAINRTSVIFLLAAISCFLWGSASPSIKTGYRLFSIAADDTWSIILFAGCRFFLAGIFVVLYECIREKRLVLPEKGSLPSIAALAAAQTVVQYFCFYIGLAHTSGVTGTILSGAGGFLSIILACFVFRMEKPTAGKLIGVAMGFLGIVVMNIAPGGNYSFNAAGDGMILLSQISYSVAGILSKKFSKRFSVVLLCGYQFILGGLVMIIVSLLMGGNVDFAQGGPAGLLLLAYLALVSAVAFTLWGILLSHNPVSRVAIFNFLTPLFGVILSAIFLGEVDQALQLGKLAALILVCVGIYVVNRESPKKVA